MKKTLLLITILFVSAASFALSDMVSVDFVDGSRTVPIEDLKDMYYSNTKDSFYLALEDTTYAFKADSSLHVSFLDSIEGQHKREREALIAIYKALDGDNWDYNDNWCSDKPLSEWEGIHALDPEFDVHSLTLFINTRGDSACHIFDGKSVDVSILKELINIPTLHTLQLISQNELYGTFPKEIFSMPNISTLEIYSNTLCVDIPNDTNNIYTLHLNCKKVNFAKSLNKYKKLNWLTINSEVNEIPEDIGDCENIEVLAITNPGNCSGIDYLPKSISRLTNLKQLDISNNNFEFFPDVLNKLTNLNLVNIATSSIMDTLPSQLFKRNEIHYLNLRDNHFYGKLPSELTHILSNTSSKLFNIDNKICLDFNNLSGDIPQEIQDHPNWCKYWQTIILNNRFNYKNIYLPGSQFEGVDITGDSIKSEDVYVKNKYTILWSMDTEHAKSSSYVWNVDTMKYFYEKYKDYGVEILYAAAEWDTPEAIRAFREECNVPMKCFSTHKGFDERISINNDLQTTLFLYYLDPDNILGNSLMVVDSTGKAVFLGELDGYELELDHFLCRNLLKDSIDYYVSSDYSQHMLVDTLQLATKGKGIDIVLMGDAYSDQQIADSTYYKDMLYLYNNLFTDEPYKSYKDMFNVYIVNVVSDVEGYGNGPTALGGYFGEETEVGGNDGAVMRYAQQVLDEERLIDATVIVAMNSDRYAGTCYMYYHNEPSKVDGCGLSISYFPKGGDSATFAQLLHHEALGHGFPKLADEYAYEWNEEIPELFIKEYTMYKSELGWFKNVDFTNDSNEISWTKLLFDERYQYDGLGIFEGGLTYLKGVWRPTENSIMRYNTGGFNAPSREAIYYRIHKLAYGDEWEYDYEKFVEWDAKNRKKADSPLLMPSREAIRNFVPTHPPVIKQMNWREALESEQTPQRSQIKAKEGVSVYDKSINQLPNTNKYVFTTYSNDEQ